MKKNKIVICVLLIIVFIGSCITFSILMPHCNYAFKDYLTYKGWNNDLNDDFLEASINASLNRALSTLFAIIFSALSAIASAVTLFLLNFKIWKEKKN